MNRRPSCRLPYCALLSLALLAAGQVFAATPDPVMQADHVQGQVKLQRLGRQLLLHPGDAVQARDIVDLPKGAHLSLQVRGGGTLELAGPSRFSVEQLADPEKVAGKADAAMGQTPDIFNLEHGQLHLQWTPASAQDASATLTKSTPLYVYFAHRRVQLQPGEYFLDERGRDAEICVASGRAETMTIAAGARNRLGTDQCEVQRGDAGQVIARSASAWAGLREQFAFNGDAADNAGTRQASLRIDPRLSRAAPTPAPVVRQTAAPVAPPSQHDDRRAANDDGKDAAWAVNVASYSDADSAEQQKQQLQASGYTAVVVPAEVGGKTFYRVQVSGFPSPDAAHAQAVALQSDLGYSQLWVTRQP